MARKLNRYCCNFRWLTVAGGERMEAMRSIKHRAPFVFGSNGSPF